MAINVGGEASTVNVRVPLVPPAVATATVRVPAAALGSMVKVAVSAVALVTTTLLADTPPLTVTDVAPVTKLVPVIETLTDVPRTPLDGVRLTAVGAGGVTVSVCEPVVPPVVVTVTVRPPRAASLAAVNLAVSDVVLVRATSLTVTPAPLTATVAPATKLVPVSVNV
jgi:hypothetical protein